jgi:hypothetical protein
MRGAGNLWTIAIVNKVGTSAAGNDLPREEPPMFIPSTTCALISTNLIFARMHALKAPYIIKRESLCR